MKDSDDNISIASLQRRISELEKRLAGSREYIDRAPELLVQRPADLAALLESFGQQVFSHPDIEGCLVNLVREGGEDLETVYLRLPREFSELQSTYKHFVYHAEQPDVNVCVFKSGKSIVVTEADLGEYAEMTRIRFERWKMKNLIVLPLYVEPVGAARSRIGTVMIFSQSKMLDEALAAKIDAIGALFAAQFQIHWKYEQMLARAKAVEVMYAETNHFISYISEMNSLTAVDEVYASIGKEFIRRFHFDLVGILLAEEDELGIVHTTFSEPFAHIGKRYQAFQESFKYSLGMRDGASAMVFGNNQRFHFEDVMKVISLPMSAKDKKSLEMLETLRTFLIVPIRLNNVPIGVLWLGTLGQTMTVPESDLTLIELLASFISTAIRNAQTHDLVEKQNAEIELLNRDLKNKMALLDQVARRDRLTGLNNFGNFEEELKRRTSEYARAGDDGALSALLVDVDHFKVFNDTYGHPAGNQVLQELAARMVEGLREMDFVARYGGEEFIALLPQCDLSQAAVVAERLRSRINGTPFMIDGKAHNITISGGYAKFIPTESASDFISRVDVALYAAKRKGRNRIEVAAEPG